MVKSKWLYLSLSHSRSPLVGLKGNQCYQEDFKSESINHFITISALKIKFAWSFLAH